MNKAKRNARRLVKILTEQYGCEYVEVLALLALKGTEYFAPDGMQLAIGKLTIMFNGGYPTNVTFNTQGEPVFNHKWPKVTPLGPEE